MVYCYMQNRIINVNHIYYIGIVGVIYGDRNKEKKREEETLKIVKKKKQLAF